MGVAAGPLVGQGTVASRPDSPAHRLEQLSNVLWQLGYQVPEFFGAHRIAHGRQYGAGTLSGPLIIHSRARPYLMQELREIEPFGEFVFFVQVSSELLGKLGGQVAGLKASTDPFRQCPRVWLG